MNQIAYEGGPGDTLEQAVIIRGAANHAQGVGAEYRYLEQTFGQRGVDWTLDRQVLLQVEGRPYDEMRIHLADGTRRVVYFDLSDFFGRF